ncbi:MAG TPA: phosphoribosylformylglycinamidine cyclo-ligase, partial [Firmicutes bacterium]|nr:phosphoribosylformylglycinamidine cyclo-ligase [Bacillota bacterium]
DIRGMAHITGGGLPENLPRVLPPGLDFILDKRKIPVTPVFSLLQSAGNVPETDMYRTFNMGIGFVLVISPGDFASFEREMDKQGEKYFLIGEVVPGEGKVLFKQ